MRNTYTIHVYDTANRLVATYTLTPGTAMDPLRLSVQPGFRVEILNAHTGLPPNCFWFRRTGDNLELRFADEETVEEGRTEAVEATCDTPPDLILEHFYGLSEQVQITGLPSEAALHIEALSGSYGSCEYTQVCTDTLVDFADQGAGVWWAVGGILLGGAALAAVAAGSSSGGGSGGDDDNDGNPIQPPIPVDKRADILTVIDNVELHTGPILNGGLTNDSTPTLHGSLTALLDAGEYVAVYRDGVFVGMAELDGNNPLVWSFTDNLTSLPDGPYTYTVRVIDANGNPGQPSPAYGIMLDTTPPVTGNAVEITAYVDDVEPGTGEFGPNTSTNDASPLLRGTVSGLDSGDVVLIFLGTTLLGTATVTGNAWTFQVTGLANGTYTFTAVIADAAGNLGTMSHDFTLTVDLTPPSSDKAVSITSYMDDVEPGTGEFDSSVPTNDTSPLLQGTVFGLQAGDRVLIYGSSSLLRARALSDDWVLIGEATVDGNGRWTFQLEGLTEGIHTFTAVIVDAAGNPGAQSEPFTLTVDLAPPPVVQSLSITSYVDDVEPDTGVFGPNTSTNDPTPLLQGTVTGLQPGEGVFIYRGRTFLGVATVTGDTWMFQVPGLSNGVHTFTAIIVDTEGTGGMTSASFTLTVIDPPPLIGNAVEIVSYVDDVAPKVGEFTSAIPTNDTSPLLQGLVSGLGPNDYVLIYQNATLLGRATLDGNGGWTFQTNGLAEGTHRFTAVIANETGGEGTRSTPFDLTVDRTPPNTGNTVAITAFRDDVEPEVGDFISGSSTNDTTPALLGTVSGLQNGDVVLIFEDDVFLGEARVTRAGTWSFRLPELAEGDHTFTAIIADAAGNRGTISNTFTLTVDLTPPTTGNAVAITAYVDDVDPQQGEFDFSIPTNDTSPLLRGTVSGLDPGDRVLVFKDGVFAGEATLDGAGGWTLQLNDLAEGVHVLNAFITDAAENRGTVSADFPLVVDLTSPTRGNAVAIASYRDDEPPNVGEFDESIPTNDTSPVLVGTVTGLQPGDVVLIFMDGVFVGQAALDRAVRWTLPLSELTEGPHVFEAVIADAAGNLGTRSTPFTLTVNLAPPNTGNAVDITAYIDDYPPQTGEFDQDTPTNDISPVLKGTVSGLQPGDVVLIYEGNDFVGQAVLDGAGGWTLPLEGLAEGPHTYTAVITDASGNPGTRSGDFTITVDLSPPLQGNAVNITAYVDDEEPNTGVFGSDVPTNDTSPVLRGTVSGLQPGDVVLIYHGSVLVGPATITGQGTWELEVEELNEGVHIFTAVISDAAGNEGTRSTNFVLTVDLTGPTLNNGVAITSYEDDIEPNTGIFGSGVPTNDRNPVLQGTVYGLQAGDVVLIYDGTTFVDQASVDSLGNWTLQLNELAEGDHLFTAVIVDAAGNPGTRSPEFSLPVDTLSPTSGTVAITAYRDQQAPDIGDYGSGTITDDVSPILLGTVTGLEPGDVVLIYNATTNELLGKADITGNNWTYQLLELDEGSHSFRAVIADAAGNQGSASGVFAFEVRLPTPGANAVAITSYEDNVELDTGIFTDQSKPTNDDSPLLRGTASGLAAGDSIRVYDGTTLLGTAIPDITTGDWELQLTGLSEGTHVLSAVITNGGSEGTRSRNFLLTVDLTRPDTGNTVAITAYVDDQEPNIGEFLSGTSTNDTDPLLKGAALGLQDGDRVAIYQNNVFLDYAVLDGSGNWTLQLVGLNEETYNFRAEIVDAAGNRGTRSTDFFLTVDTTPPSTGNTVAITHYVDNVPLNEGSFLSGSVTNDPSPLLVGTVSGLQPGDTVLIFRDSTLLGPAILDGSGGWTYQVFGLTEGQHTFRAVITDAAGNRGTTSTDFILNLDITPPLAGNAVEIVSYLDSVDPNVGSFASGVPTNDRSPVLQGTVRGLQPGDVVLIFNGTTLLGPATLDGSGGWTYQLTNLDEGGYTYRAVIADAAGNRGTQSNAFEIIVDVTSPTTNNSVSITSYVDDELPQVGEFPSTTPTNDTSPLLKGTVNGLMAGDSVRIYWGTTYLGTATLDNRGGWTYQVQGLTEGVHVFTAVIADAAGNEGTQSN